MPKAVQEITPAPARLSHPKAAALVEAVAQSAPTILDLGRHMAALQKAYDAHDITELRKSVMAGDAAGLLIAERHANEASTIIYDRQEAIRELIGTLPAATLADVAVQAAEITVIAGRLSANQNTEAEVDRAASRIERMALGMLPVVAATAGLDLADMDWTGRDALRKDRFAGVEVQS